MSWLHPILEIHECQGSISFAICEFNKGYVANGFGIKKKTSIINLAYNTRFFKKEMKHVCPYKQEGDKTGKVSNCHLFIR